MQPCPTMQGSGWDLNSLVSRCNIYAIFCGVTKLEDLGQAQLPRHQTATETSNHLKQTCLNSHFPKGRCLTEALNHSNDLGVYGNICSSPGWSCMNLMLSSLLSIMRGSLAPGKCRGNGDLTREG